MEVEISKGFQMHRAKAELEMANSLLTVLCFVLLCISP